MQRQTATLATAAFAQNCRLPTGNCLTPPIPAVSTPLHCSAASDPLRWLALSFRFIPRLELWRQAGGFSPVMPHADAMSHASFARYAEMVWKQSLRG
jgi:hypothetical protein